MSSVLIGVGVVALACVVAFVLRRRTPEPPTQTVWSAPQQLDRADFVRPDAPWLVAAFTSATCHTCAAVAIKLEPLRSDAVAVQVIDYELRKALHERYRIDAVPTTVIADAEGVVQRHFVGPVTATDLWAAVAEARRPASNPEPDTRG